MTLGSHLFRVCVDVPRCQNMTDYGMTVMRKKLGLQPSMGILMMRTRLLKLNPVIRKERRSLIGETSIEEIVMIEDMIDRFLPEIKTEGIIRKCNALIAKNLVILNEIYLRKRVRRGHPELRLMMSPQERSLEMSILQI